MLPCRALTQAVQQVAMGTAPGYDGNQQSLGRGRVGSKGKGDWVSEQSKTEPGEARALETGLLQAGGSGAGSRRAGTLPSLGSRRAGSRAGAVGMRHAAASHVLSMHRAEARGAVAASPAGHASWGPMAEPEPGQWPAICWARPHYRGSVLGGQGWARADGCGPGALPPRAGQLRGPAVVHAVTLQGVVPAGWEGRRPWLQTTPPQVSWMSNSLAPPKNQPENHVMLKKEKPNKNAKASV